MANPFDFFDRIFCINLDRRPERWEAAQSEFAKVGILERVERFSAIDCVDGARGCLQSHLTCVRLARSAGATNALIFEDDVCFLPGLHSQLEATLRDLQHRPWELFYLGGEVVSRATRIGSNLISARVYQAHAYAIHQRAFDKVPVATAPIDYWYANHLKSLGARAPLAVQRTVESDIGHGIVDRDARRSYEVFVEATYAQYLAKRAYYGARRALGRALIRVARPLGVPLTFVGGRPKWGGRRGGA